ncbi:MAG: SpoIIE family protein phosphatase [Bacteroidales bacterium]|nr:SpoIIE family protein phosphatase [Bacteroidales bacterium]
MKRKVKSFSARLTWRIVLMLLAIMSVISLIIYFLTAATATLLTSERYQNVMEIANERVESVLNAVEVSSVNNVSEIRKHLTRPDELFDALESELGLNSHIIGAAMAFTPNFFPRIGRWYEPYVARRDSVTIERLQIGSAEHDYFTFDWYRKPMESGRGYWSEPYFDSEGARTMLCTYSLPVQDGQDRTVAVFGADLSLAWLTEQMEEDDRRENSRSVFALAMDSPSVDWKDGKASYSVILGRRGEYIVHPDKDRILVDHFFDHVDTLVAPDSIREAREMMQSGRPGSGLRMRIDGVDAAVYFSRMARTGWTMAIIVPRELIKRPGFIIGAIVLFLIAAGLLVMFVFSYLTIRKSVRPLRKLAYSADEVAKGNFDTPLPRIRHRDEIRLLRDSFEDMEHSLKQYISQLTETTEQKASMERDLSIARGIQMSILPKPFVAESGQEGVEIFGQLTPARAVGGDLYDFYIRDGRLYFCIGDVSGKGVPASLVMAVTCAQFRMLSAGEDSPERIVSAINKSLAERNDALMFVTLFVGVLDLRTGELQYCNAGHDAPILLGAEMSDVRYLEVDPNLSAGVLAEQTYSLQKQTITPGTTIFLYTDGLTEAEDSAHALFGEERIFRALRAAGSVAPADLVGKMTGAVREFVGDAEQSDDLTMLAIRFRKGE